MQLRLVAAVAGLVLLVLFTFVWRPPQADSQTVSVEQEAAAADLLIAPPPEDLAAPATVVKTDRLVQPAGGSTIANDAPLPAPVTPAPQAGSAIKNKPRPKPAPKPGVAPRVEGGSVLHARPRGVPALPVAPRVPEAGSVVQRNAPQRLPAMPPTVQLGAAVRVPTPSTATASTLARFIAFSPDGLQLAIGDSDGEIRLINVEAKSVTRSIKLKAGALLKLLYTPDGALLASGTDQQLCLFDTVSGDVVRRYKPGVSFESMSLMPNGEHVIAKTDQGRVVRFSLTSGEALDLGLNGAGTALAVSPDGRHAATSSINGAIQVWPLDPPAEPYLIEGAGSVRCLAFSPDSQQLAAGCLNQWVRFWTIGSKGEFRSYRNLPAVPQVSGLQFGRDFSQIFVSSQATFSYVTRIDPQTGATTPLTDGNPPSTICDLAISPDRLTLAALFRDRSIQIITFDPASSDIRKQFAITAARDK